MTPAKVYTEMKDSGADWIGKIPATWDISKIGTLYTQRNERVSDRDYPPLSVTMKGILPQLATAAKTDDGDNRKLVRVGDFAINSRSDRRGSCGISPYDGSVSLINTILIPRKKMHPGYYDWLFHTTLFADEFYKWGHGIVDDLWTTRWQEMKRILVPVPPYETQSTIAAYLDTQCAKIDEIIAQAKASIENYKQWKASIIYEAVTKGLDPNVEMKDSGILSNIKIPAHWNTIRMKFVSTISGRIGFRGYTTQDLVDAGEGAITLSPSNIKDTGMSYDKCSYISWDKYYESPEIMAKNGDILFVKTGSSYGKSALVEKLPTEATINPQLVLLKNIKGVQPKYLFYFLQSPLAKVQIEFIVSGGTIPTMSQEKMRNYTLPYPSAKEQNEISLFLDEQCTRIAGLIAEKQSLIDDLESYKKSLIYEVVTGKRRVC